MLISILILLLIGYIFYGFATATSKPPDIPYYGEDAVNPKIIKNHNLYMLEYKFQGKKLKNYIGNSSKDLEPFINKNDVIINANYPKNYEDYLKYSRKEQCIKESCIKFFKDPDGSALVIDIVDISIK